MSEKLEKLINCISSDHIKAVSFDIFDTLLLRPVMFPTDMFWLAAGETCYEGACFAEMRVTAEQEARQRRAFYVDDIELDDIYYEMMTLYDISLEETKALKELELDTEATFLYPRKSVKQIYDTALALNKEIIISSDMYLPGDFLEKVLHKNGYHQYSQLYVSGEYKLSKATGRLYDRIVRDLESKGIRANEIIHFGDDYSADVTEAQKHGLQVGYIPSTTSRLRENRKLWDMLSCLDPSADNAVNIGMLANEMFDDPFISPINFEYSPLFGELQKARLRPTGISSEGKMDVLKRYLKKLHLLDIAKKLNGQIKASIRKRELVAKLDLKIANSLKELSVKKPGLNNNVLVIGDMVSFDKGVCNYLNQLSKQLNLVLVSETTWISRERTSAKVRFPFYIVPGVLGKNQYVPHKNIKISADMRKMLEKKTYLGWAVSNWKNRFPDMGIGYPEMLAFYAQKYYVQVFDLLAPKCIILWNAFHALHHIIEGLAREKNIPVMYMEFGSLPGTFVLETSGQMGESWPATNYEEFKNLEVSSDEMEEAAKIWSYIKKSKLNRNVQPKNTRISDIQEKLKPGRPVILYAGQNDYESGLYPYTEHTAQYHSPAFHSSDEAAEYLDHLAAKNNWNLIYKPHPIMTWAGCARCITKTAILVDDCDLNDLIDMSDITVTILSQTGYISMIREKPTLMLGYTQLKGKGCTYEAFSKEKIDEVILEALENGLTIQMKENFKKHIAQMLKFYLYDDLLDRELRYGRTIEDAVYGIQSIIN